jgi:histidine triad (HIT) family protein
MAEPAAEDCLFCAIARGTVPADLVHETDRVLAFRDVNPQAPTHVLVIPRDHHPNVAALASADAGLLAELVAEVATVAAQQRITDYRLVFNTGRASGQSVFHVHGHVLGGRDFTWPPG